MNTEDLERPPPDDKVEILNSRQAQQVRTASPGVSKRHAPSRSAQAGATDMEKAVKMAPTTFGQDEEEAHDPIIMAVTTSQKDEGDKNMAATEMRRDEEMALPEQGAQSKPGVVPPPLPWWKTKKGILIASASLLLIVVIVVFTVIGVRKSTVTCCPNPNVNQDPNNPATTPPETTPPETTTPEPITTPLSGTWEKLGDDINGDNTFDYSAMYAISLSADGRTIAIGGHGDDDGPGSNAGHVRVRQWKEGSWVRSGPDIDGVLENEEAGTAVSLSSDGSMVAIGAPKNDAMGDEAGRAAVYRLHGASWVRVGQDLYGNVTEDYFGIAISLSADGQFLAVGANQQESDSTGPGYARVYQFVDETWDQLGQDIVGDADGEEFGSSVSLSDDGKKVAIGAPENDNGRVNVYHLQGEDWVKLGHDIDGEGEYDNSGSSVSLSADGMTVAVGAPRNGSWNRGHARVHRLIGGNWERVGPDLDGTDLKDWFGYAVSLSAGGNMLAVGAPQSGNETNPGYARVFQLVGASWFQLGQDIFGNGPDDELGTAISLSADGKTIAVGGRHGPAGTNSGHASVYVLNEQ